MTLRDNDEPGLKYAQEFAYIIGRLSNPPVVKIVNLPGFPEHGDLVDFVDNRREGNGDSIRAEIEAIVKQTEPTESRGVGGGLVLTRMSEIEPQSTEWLWNHRIPLGTLTVVAGPQGDCKTHLMLDIAARVTTGTAWPEEFKDHTCRVRPRRLTAFTDKRASEELRRQIEKLVALKSAGAAPDLELTRWLECVPARVCTKLAEWGLLDAARIAASKALADQHRRFQSKDGRR